MRVKCAIYSNVVSFVRLPSPHQNQLQKKYEYRRAWIREFVGDLELEIRIYHKEFHHSPIIAHSTIYEWAPGETHVGGR